MLSALPLGLSSATHKPRPARCIHPLLLASTKTDDMAGNGIGYIDMGMVKSTNNIEFETKGSGLLFGKDKRNAYVEADPRVRSERRQSLGKYQRMEVGTGSSKEVHYIELSTGMYSSDAGAM